MKYLILILLALSACTTCDGIAFRFYPLGYESSDHSAAVLDFIHDNTVNLNCTDVTLNKEANLFSKYNIIKYDATVTCDIVEFSDEFYFINDSLYILEIGMGPCGSENVHIYDEFPYDQDYETRIVDLNMKNLEFCKAYHEKQDGDVNVCYRGQAEELMWESPSEALDACDKIDYDDNYLRVSDCYDYVIDAVQIQMDRRNYDPSKEAQAEVVGICNRFFEKYPTKSEYHEYSPGKCYDILNTEWYEDNTEILNQLCENFISRDESYKEYFEFC